MKFEVKCNPRRDPPIDKHQAHTITLWQAPIATTTSYTAALTKDASNQDPKAFAGILKFQKSIPPIREVLVRARYFCT